MLDAATGPTAACPLEPGSLVSDIAHFLVKRAERNGSCTRNEVLREFKDTSVAAINGAMTDAVRLAGEMAPDLSFEGMGAG